MSNFYPTLYEANNGISRATINKINLGSLDRVKAKDGSIVNLKRIKDEINKIRTLIVAQDPLYAPFVYSLGIVYTWAVKTMATDGNWIFVNPKWTEKLSFDETTFVIYHELMHCLLDHMKRGKMGNYNHKKFNYAADYEINAMFIDMQEDYEANSLFSGALKGALYNIEFLNKPAEYIYTVIPDPPASKKSSGGGSNSGGGGSADDEEDNEDLGEQDEDDDRLQDEVSDESGDLPGGIISPELGKKIAKQAGLSEEEIAEGNQTADDWTKKSKELLDRALRQNKASGGGAGNMLTKILGNHHNSIINWKAILNRLAGDILARKDLRWAMPNRRYSAGDPNAIRIRATKTGKQLSKIIVCMDTSGSMEKKLIQSIVDEINAILRSKKVKEITVLFFDDEIKDPQTITGNQRAYCPEVVGGGGTNFQVPLDYIKAKYKDQVSLCLFFTDGYEEIPKKPIYADKFIWIVYDNPNWPNTNYVGSNPAFGKKILVNTKSLETSVKKANESVKFYGQLL